MLDAHVPFVARTLRKAGVPTSEIDDEVQRTFIIAARRLEELELDSERRFLFNVALNLAAHARRTLARRREISSDEVPEPIDFISTPERLTERKRLREMLDGIVDRMPESLRAVFMLHAFEEMSRTEIAAALGIPRGTVASRLRRAQEQFHKHADATTWAREGRA